MKRRFGLAIFAALAGSAALAATPISVAGGDWSDIPRIEQAGKLRISDSSIEQMEAAAIGECKLRGQTERHVDLTIPFLVRFSQAGELQQVVVRRMNCPTIERVAGSALLTMAQGGEYRPTGENLEGWYRGEISFVSR